MQNVKDDEVGKIMFWQQCSEAQLQACAEFQGDWCSTDTFMEKFTP
jgi:hypothetical protein